MDREQVVAILMSGKGTPIAGILLAFIVYAFKQWPWLAETYLRERWQKRAATTVLAMIPAISLALIAEQPWAEVLTAALNAFLVAVGFHHFALDKPKPAAG
ncbi:MAG: hypothetical protein HOV80_17600 [Polyangiaceae bacterium]|nr:hypothetical protein [Polyangiaceae bacterium]